MFLRDLRDVLGYLGSGSRAVAVAKGADGSVAAAGVGAPGENGVPWVVSYVPRPDDVEDLPNVIAAPPVTKHEDIIDPLPLMLEHNLRKARERGNDDR